MLTVLALASSYGLDISKAKEFYADYYIVTLILLSIAKLLKDEVLRRALLVGQSSSRRLNKCNT